MLVNVATEIRLQALGIDLIVAQIPGSDIPIADDPVGHCRGITFDVTGDCPSTGVRAVGLVGEIGAVGPDQGQSSGGGLDGTAPSVVEDGNCVTFPLWTSGYLNLGGNFQAEAHTR